MTSREIIINLIDKGVINGEQAAILFNDIFQSEILESWKALNNKGNHDLTKDVFHYNDKIWVTAPNITWTGGSDTSSTLTTSNITGDVTSV